MSAWTPVPAVRSAVVDNDATVDGGVDNDATVDGVDIDAVAAAARACPGVEQLHGDPPYLTATYLPGRRVEGVRIEPHTIVIQVQARWGVPATELAAQIRGAIAPVANGRRIDIIVAGVGDPTYASCAVPLEVR